jgi:hypothetical protein
MEDFEVTVIWDLLHDPDKKNRIVVEELTHTEDGEAKYERFYAAHALDRTTCSPKTYSCVLFTY